MNEHRLQELLKERLAADMHDCEIKEDDTDNPPPRDRLLGIFSTRLGRLRNIESPTVAQQALLPELERLVGHLEALPSDARLYIWKARSGELAWGGWCTDDAVIYAVCRQPTG